MSHSDIGLKSTFNTLSVFTTRMLLNLCLFSCLSNRMIQIIITGIMIWSNYNHHYFSCISKMGAKVFS